MENLQAPAESTGTPAETAVYTVQMTGAQIFGFADLVRRLTAAPADLVTVGEPSRYLRQDLAQALLDVLDLTPEPSEDDGDAYLAAVAAGQFPAWQRDERPLVETLAERAARARAQRDSVTVVARAWDDSPCPFTGRVTADLGDELVDVAWGDEQYKDNPQSGTEYRDELRTVSPNQ